MRSNPAMTLLAAALIAALASCSKMDAAAPEEQAAAAAPAMDMAADAGAAEASAATTRVKAEADRSVETATTVDAAQLASSATSYSDSVRRFIRTAKVDFRVKDVYGSAMAIEDAAAEQGGFVVNNDISAQTTDVRRTPAGDGALIELAEYTVRGTLTVRVPSENTQAFLRAIASQMEFLDQRDFEAVDAQFQVLRQQLAWQRQQQTQQALGDAVTQGDRLDRKADVIAARGDAQLQRDEALIQRKEFEDKVAFSTIELSLYQLPKIRQTEMVDTDAVFAQHSPGFFPRLGDALRVGWYGVLDLFIALMHIWPVWLLAGLGLWLLRRWGALRRRERPQPPAMPAGEA